MERIWAPWRDQYITNISKQRKGCVFCRIAGEKKDAANLIFVRKAFGFAVLNKYPYNNGHALVLPYRHVGDLSRLRREERAELLDLVIEVQQLLKTGLKAQGFNVGMNLGRVAGAGEPGHLHIHIVPRWKGDVNFMPVVGETKVISQSLAATRSCLAKIARQQAVESQIKKL